MNTKLNNASKKFLHEVKTMSFNELIKLPCASGGIIQIEKANEKHYNLLYFNDTSIQPIAVTTDYPTIEYAVYTMSN